MSSPNKAVPLWTPAMRDRAIEALRLVPVQTPCLMCAMHRDGFCLHWQQPVPPDALEAGCTEWQEACPF